MAAHLGVVAECWVHIRQCSELSVLAMMSGVTHLHHDDKTDVITINISVSCELTDTQYRSNTEGHCQQLETSVLMIEKPWHCTVHNNSATSIM